MSKMLLDYFAEVTDPRVERTKLHKLEDILAIAICATICGAEGWTEMAGKFPGIAERHCFRRYLSTSDFIVEAGRI